MLVRTGGPRCCVAWTEEATSVVVAAPAGQAVGA